MTKPFNRYLLTQDDFEITAAILPRNKSLWEPDLVIAPDGDPYLYRWALIPRNECGANVYFHVQVGSDPERPLHDHPWDNQSVILSGGYDEIWNPQPWFGTRDAAEIRTRRLRKGDVVHRRAGEAHRLILPPDIPYTMSLFTTGPVLRPWGFWFPDGWVDADAVTRMEDGASVMVEERRETS